MRAYAITWLAYLSACVLACLACLLAYVLGRVVCLRAWRALVFDALACSCAWRAFVFACLTYVVATMRAWHAQHWRTRVFV